MAWAKSQINDTAAADAGGARRQLMAASRTAPRWGAAVVAMVTVALLVGACGGDSQSNTGTATGNSDTSEESSGDSESESDGTASGPIGPIVGPLVSVLSFDFGLWTIDPDSGEATALTLAGADFSDREDPAVVANGGSEAYLVVFTLVEGQEFTYDAALARVDLGAGEISKLAELGQTQTDDTSTDRVSHHVVGASATTVWLERVAAEGERTLVGYDRESGAENGTAPADAEARILNPIVVGDDLYGQQHGFIVRWDGSTWAEVANFDDVTLNQAMTVDSVNDYAITKSGAPIDADWAQAILDWSFNELQLTNAGWAAGDGKLWWLWNDRRDSESDSAIMAGFVEFDPATATVVALHPLGSIPGTFLEDDSTTAVGSGSWSYRDGAMWFADNEENGKLYKVVSGVGTTAFDIPVPDGIDFTRIETIDTDPDALWIDVGTWVITKDDDTGRSASGTSTLDRFNTETGQSELMVAETGLVGGF